MKGSEVRRRREAAGLTQRALADMVKGEGVSRSLIALIESDRATVPERLALVVASLPPMPLPPTPVASVEFMTAGSSGSVKIHRYDGTEQVVEITEGQRFTLDRLGNFRITSASVLP